MICSNQNKKTMATNNEDKVIKDAQYRKGLSIAFFNATNSAISLCQGMNVNEESTLENVSKIRDFFLEEYKKYYASVIAQVGINYKADETIEKLKKTKNKEELSSVWISLSEDERRDGEIIKVARELRDKYNEKTPNRTKK